MSDLTEAPTGELPPPLPEPALDELTAELVETARENASAAAGLSQYSDLSSVEPADVASIENDACQVSAQAAVDRLAQVAPRADLAALPAVNLITGQIADCGPATADSFSNAAFSFLLRNTSTTPSGQGPEAPSLSPVYDAACKGFKRGIAGRINRWLKIRGGARYGITLAVGAAVESCPEHACDGPSFLPLRTTLLPIGGEPRIGPAFSSCLLVVRTLQEYARVTAGARNDAAEQVRARPTTASAVHPEVLLAVCWREPRVIDRHARLPRAHSRTRHRPAAVKQRRDVPRALSPSRTWLVLAGGEPATLDFDREAV